MAHTYGIFPPTLSSRISSPQPDAMTMVPCPDPNCEGENKPKAKFCSECGRPLTGASRASTPAMSAFSPQQTYPYMSPSYGMNQQYYGNQGYPDQQIVQQPPVPETPAPDPLQRNRGHPLASFGFGGKLCLIFPSKLNVQDANAKIMPGLVQMKNIKELVLPDASPLSDFVGPVLLDPSMDIATKKESAATYMGHRIQDFYSQLQSLEQGSSDYYRLENKSLLWQLVKMLILEDFSGNSDGKDAAIRSLLHPGQFIVESDTLAMIRNYLLQGDRSSALQYTIQEKMWAHGLIIGKSIDQGTFASVVDQFVDQALATTIENEHTGFYQNALGDRPSLRVLYSLFAGTGSNSVSHFIPSYSTQAIEQQLSEWRETVALILANRVEQSDETIHSLGNILKENGWMDAANICFILSSSKSFFDDEWLDGQLLGSQEGNDISSPLDALYISELFEFALSLDQRPSILPFLQGYKLVHAWWLSDAGYVKEASHYLQSIVNGLISYDRPSTYFHQGFLDNLKELAELCRASSDQSVG
ncbi:Sec23-binding domain of Sec16-domain-containing protein [Halteromyces radiatus]|uniref:Sec23-binding domain of Sec16-domain-containing protein n=1 Tax=Halteromyces radiatus TaxID=101107 RepID=UPI0022202370|nr:Sec23-binding domain of Sec16-domain-containing protein [Halteromyces radiatus]KAI8100131.1 Sec23-binding domain of Sec16-domain-containing protein [Halteromyces radiatus]